MFATVGQLQVPYVLMHMRGTPQTMQQHTHYHDLIPDLLFYFQEKVAALREAGVHDILLDPGFGFAKSTAQNFTMLRQLRDFQWLGLPVLAGISRKSMVYKSVGGTPADALTGTTALHMAALLGGAAILRVHDVKEARQTIDLFRKLQPLTYQHSTTFI